MKYRTFGKAIDKMKSFKNLYIKLLDKKFIAECIYKASRGKRKRGDVKRVLNNVLHYVEVIYEMLDTDSFEQKPHRVREITERGKTRIIVIPHFIESIVHYMVIEILKPIFMNRFSNFSCASIPGRGASHGKRLVLKAIRKLQRRHSAFPRIYVFKMDVKKYFRSINRDILLSKLSRLIADKRFVSLLSVIIDCPDVPGLPLGFLTSQWLANFYLNDLDRYLLSNLKQPFTFRYMDDVVILSHYKSSLHWIRHIVTVYLDCTLDLKVKENYQTFQLIDCLKGFSTGRPLDFMGLKFYYNRVTLRKSILRSIRRTIYRVYRKQRKTIYDTRRSLSALGWLKQAQTHKYFERCIYPFTNPKQLRTTVSNYDRRYAA